MYENLQNFLILLACISIIGFILYLVLKSPFRYPHFEHCFDVSGKRNPDIENLIDVFLNYGNFFRIQEHQDKIEQWKIASKKKIEKSVLKAYRRKQYLKSLDNNSAYIFYLTKKQTRYRQRNYRRTSYKVLVNTDTYHCGYNYLFHRNEQLKAIHYECTLKEYNSKNQRKLMTKNLRREIMVRDKYTCQLCGKYMPDEVGLQVDHIVPISKGGKTVPSNLQVLCSKCNGSKSGKLYSNT